MLTKRLKEKELFEDDLKVEERRHDALKILDESVEDLIITMVGIENEGVYEREEIENYVLKRKEYYETLFYGMDDDEFDEYLTDKIAEKFTDLLIGGLK